MFLKKKQSPVPPHIQIDKVLLWVHVKQKPFRQIYSSKLWHVQT